MKRLVRVAHDRYDSLDFPGLGKTIVLTHPDEDAKAAAWANAELDVALATVSRLNDETAAAAQDRNLSPAGRVAKVAPFRETANKVIGAAAKEARDELTEVAAERAKLFGPPALQSTDALGALTDIEIRSRYAAMDPNTRMQVLNSQPRAELGRVLAALLRDPIASPERKQAEDLWGAYVEGANADAVKALDVRQRVAQWLLLGLNSLNEAVMVTNATTAQAA